MIYVMSAIVVCLLKFLRCLVGILLKSCQWLDEVQGRPQFRPVSSIVVSGITYR